MIANIQVIKKKIIGFIIGFDIRFYLFFFISVFSIEFISGMCISLWYHNNSKTLIVIFDYIESLNSSLFTGAIFRQHWNFLSIFYFYIYFTLVKFLYNKWYLGFKNQFFKNITLFITLLIFLSFTGTMLNGSTLARQYMWVLATFVSNLLMIEDVDHVLSWLLSNDFFVGSLPYLLIFHCILAILLFYFLIKHFLTSWKTFNLVYSFVTPYYFIIMGIVAWFAYTIDPEFLGRCGSNFTDFGSFYHGYFFEPDLHFYFIQSVFTKTNYKIIIFVFYFFSLYFLPSLKQEEGFLFSSVRRLVNDFFFLVWFLSVLVLSVVVIDFIRIMVQDYELSTQIIFIVFLMHNLSYIILYLSHSWRVLYFILNFVKKFKFIITFLDFIMDFLIMYFEMCYKQYPISVISICYMAVYMFFFTFFKSINLFNLWIICFFIFLILLAIYLLSFKLIYRWKKIIFISNYFLIFLYSFWFVLCLETAFDEPVNIFCSYIFIFYNESIWSINFVIKLWLIFFFILFYFLLKAYLNFSISNLFEMPILLLFILISILYVGIFNDIFSIFIIIEVISLIIIGICGISITKKSAEIALKYFTINIIVSSITLFGLLLIYFIFKTSNLLIICNITELSFINTKYTLILKIIINIGVLLWLLCFFFKLGIFPLNIYVPDIYESASLSVVFCISSILKPIIFFTFTKIYYILFNYADTVLFILNLIFIINIFVGDIKAINSDKIRRSFGHISIGQYGFLCISLAPKNGDVVVFSSLYLFVYNVLLFLVFLLLVEYRNFKYNQIHIEYFSQLSNFIKYNNYSKYVLILCILLLSSLPPSILFIYKYFIFLNILISNNYIYLFIILIINLLNYFYYFKILVDLSSRNNIKLVVLKNLDFTSYLQNYKTYYFLLIYIVLFILTCFIFYFDIIYGVFLVTFHHLIMFSPLLKKKVKLAPNKAKKLPYEAVNININDNEQDALISKETDTSFMDHFNKLKKTDPLLALKEVSAEVWRLRRKRNNLKEMLAYHNLLRPRSKKIKKKQTAYQEAVNKADCELFVLMKTQKNFRAFIKRKKDFFENMYSFVEKNFKKQKMLWLHNFSNEVVCYERISKNLKYFLFLSLYLFLFIYFFTINEKFTLFISVPFVVAKLSKLLKFLKSKFIKLFIFFAGSPDKYRKKILNKRMKVIKKDIKLIDSKISSLKDSIRDSECQLMNDEEEISQIKKKLFK